MNILENLKVVVLLPQISIEVATCDVHVKSYVQLLDLNHCMRICVGTLCQRSYYYIILQLLGPQLVSLPEGLVSKQLMYHGLHH